MVRTNDQKMDVKKQNDKKTDVLLMTPPCIELYKGMRKIAPISPPLGLLYVAAVLEQDGIKVHLTDAYAENLDFGQIEANIRKTRPRILGMGCVTSNFNEVIRIFKIAKRIDPSIITVIGGPHVSAIPKEAIQSTESIDIVVIGEGDYTLRDIFRSIKDKKSLRTVSGIAYRMDRRIILTKSRPMISDLDKLPLPARHLLKHNLYRPSKDMSAADSFFTILTSRGCPNMCTFCSSKVLFGVKVRFRSNDNIIEEIERALQLYSTKQIVFMDDTFTIGKARVIDLCNKLKRFNLQWGCLARVNTVDLEMLTKMKWAGCNWIGYGVESGSQVILDKIKKGITLEQVRKAFQLTSKVKIPSTAFFMIGHLDDTRETIMQTIEFSQQLDATFAQFNILTPYPGTEVYGRASREGMITRDFLHYGNPKYKDPVIRLKTISSQELKRWWKKANNEFYFRPRIILRLFVNAITSWAEFKRLLSLFWTFIQTR